MARYLVVAHQTVTNPALLEKVRAVREEHPDATFVLLVPATPVRHLLFWRGEGDDQAAAGKLAHHAQTHFAKKGTPLSEVRVGAADPVEAIANEVTANPGYTGFIISTLPEETSRWQRMNLPAAVKAKYNLPTYHVVAPPEFTLADLP